MNHDIVVIGASAGGVEVLLELVRTLPPDLPAAIFIVVHVPPDYTSVLPALLTSKGPLPARHPVHGEAIVPGTIYVAPPDHHMHVNPGVVEVVRGPKDNGHRPAVDVLFRTASAAYGTRVIGVVLTGYQECGTAGLLSVKSRGGIAVVQDPRTAVASEMPRSAMSKVEVDHVVHPLELPALLTRLVAMPAGDPIEPPVEIHQLEGSVPGQPTDVVCPICEGVLTEAQPGVFQHFRCHVGHAFTRSGLLSEQTAEMERVLWAAVRVLEESSALSRHAGRHEDGELKDRYLAHSEEQMRHANYIRDILLHGDGLSMDPNAKST